MSSCAYHPDRDVVGACVNCGKLVCAECKMTLGGKIYCNPCAEKEYSRVTENTSGREKAKREANESQRTRQAEELAKKEAEISAQDRLAAIPKEVRGWNWGAFLLNWKRGIGNGVWIALLAFILFIGLIIAIVLVVEGMAPIIGLIGTIVLFVGVLMLIVNAIRKRRLRISGAVAGIGLVFFIVAMSLSGVTEILKDAKWSLEKGVPTEVTWTDRNGEPVRSLAISGELQIIVNPSSMSLASVETLVSRNGGTIFAQLPAVGMYWIRVDPGMEAGFIQATQASVEGVFPNLVVVPKQDEIFIPNDYSYETDGDNPLPVTSGNLIIDDFSDPMDISYGPDTPPIYIKVNKKDGKITLVTDSAGNFIETDDPKEAATHGDVGNYYRTNGYQLTQRTLGSNSEIDIKTEAPSSNAFIGMAGMIQGSYKINERPVINLSYGPGEYSSDPSAKYYHPKWEDYNRANNGSYLHSIMSLVDSNAAGTSGAIITWAAGNSGTDITATLDNAMNRDVLKAMQIFAVGALDGGGNLAKYSNYTLFPGTMIYIPVTGSTDKGTPIDGTSFAAPQLHYLVTQILKERPDLTPEQLRKVLFDKRVAPTTVVETPTGKKIAVSVIGNPWDDDTRDEALNVANELFPSKSKPTPAETPAQTLVPTPSLTTTPTTAITFTVPPLPPATVGEFYSHSFASATNPSGGNPPYTFMLGSGVGFPPLGLIMDLNGTLSGIPTAEGPREFEVCVKDLSGNQACGRTSLTVEEPKVWTVTFLNKAIAPVNPAAIISTQEYYSSGEFTFIILSDGTIEGSGTAQGGMTDFATYSGIGHYLSVLSISEMGHFLNRTLWHNQAALASSLKLRL